MSRYWKEPYSIAKAYHLEMHGTEAELILGHYIRKEVHRTTWRRNNEAVVEIDRDALTPLPDYRHEQLNIQPINQWIYYVYVCRFTFAFFH